MPRTEQSSMGICKGGGRSSHLMNICWQIDYQAQGARVCKENMSIFKGDIFICIGADWWHMCIIFRKYILLSVTGYFFQQILIERLLLTRYHVWVCGSSKGDETQFSNGVASQTCWVLCFLLNVKSLKKAVFGGQWSCHFSEMISNYFFAVDLRVCYEASVWRLLLIINE